jgi:hypothetical protein
MANERCRGISLQTGPRTIVFSSGRDRELRLESLTPEREKEFWERISPVIKAHKIRLHPTPGTASYDGG